MMKPINSCFRVAVSTLFIVAFIGCAHRAPQSDSNETSSVESEEPQVTLHEPESFRVSDPDGPKVVDEELEQIPTDINPLVEKWIAYFQGKGRGHMERYLARSTRYMKLMKKILRQNGLPEDLVYIALIESGFSPKATSHASAVGYWQFIKGTGKRYGLEISPLVDERRDPVMSTQAAAEYFKGLYSVFGSWYLAMASYNCGENRVKREVMNHYTRDFWELAARRRLPKETINYIPKFIAAKMIGNNPEKYGFTGLDYMTAIEFEHIKVQKPVNLHVMAEKMGVEYDELKQLNPKFKGEIAPMKGNSLELRVPLGQTAAALVAAQAAFVEKVEYVADAGETQVYKIRNGDSLYTVARKYHTTVAWLRDVNDLKKGRKLRIGQKIAVPDRSTRKLAPVKAIVKIEKREDAETATVNPEVVTKRGVYYIVQSGDTLTAIADDYNSSVEELRRMNKMSRGSVLKAGMKLKVPKDEGLPTDPSGAKSSSVAEKEKAKEKEKEALDESSSSNTASNANSAPADVRTAASNRDPQSSEAHVVKPGENLTTIAKKYGVTIHSIRKANNLTKRSLLKVGSRLTIPEGRPQTKRDKTDKTDKSQWVSPQTTEISMRKARRPRIHIVKRGENLTKIAERYRVPLQTLKEENRIHLGSKLFVGSKLLIPTAQAALF
jgi:membrane-bound lytic murein transglycosylase D